MLPFSRRILLLLTILLLLLSNLCSGNQSPATHHASNCGNDHHHHHPHHHDDEGHENQHQWEEVTVRESKRKLPEELAEEEDLKLYGFLSQHDHDHEHHGHVHDHLRGASLLTGLGLWVHALGCSLLGKLASELSAVHGKPSPEVVDSLAAFGAGAMLGDAFLHQLPHAFGGEHSHSHDHDLQHVHSALEQSHAHSLKDLSVGLSILSGIVLFLIVEKVVRYVEETSRGSQSWGHGHHHHHHHHKSTKKLKDDDDDDGVVNKLQTQSSEGKKSINANGDGEQQTRPGSTLKERQKKVEPGTAKSDEDAADGTSGKEPSALFPSNLVFGYLNLISDGVHNFTDGMALGSAFLLYGSVGGWSRTLFLLAHELPQEVGDFGILLRSGFSVSKALFFNFLSALVALAGTALALVLGHDPGYSSLIEGFTAGGFIYIAVAGVLAEMNSGKTSVRTSVVHLTTLVMGMAVALSISLLE
ncbi:IAA-alanine resistance protein 1 [Dionaea muscipula]